LQAFQTGCARECHSNCNGKATELVNNGSNIKSKFTAIKNTLTRPSVAKIIWSVVAQLQAFNLVSATQCGVVVRCVTSAYPGKSNDGTIPHDISCETVHQSIVEGGIVCDLNLAEWMASSSSLFIGIDESTKSTKRSFVEIEIGGQLHSTDSDLCIWCVPLTVKEVVSHSTMSHFTEVAEALSP